jgi:hypothetical protein
MPDIVFPHNKFGLAIRDNYSVAVDSALARVKQASGHVRQRRTYLHQASLVRLSFRMTHQVASDFLVWVRENANDWWLMKLISGNSSDACPVSRHRVKLVSTIQSNRIPLTNMVLLTFDVETHSLTDWATLSVQPFTKSWPTTLPLPQASGFVSEHGPRGYTQYTLTWTLTSKQLKDFVKFASYAGTTWFTMPMISPNVPCGTELIRFTSGVSSTLSAPDKFEVSMTAETLLDYTHLKLPSIKRNYDSNTTKFSDPTVQFNG